MQTLDESNRPPWHSLIIQGIGQLSLVEHALCPLDARSDRLRAGFQHESSYQFTDRDGRRRTARARVACPNGLTPNDEFYLWGLLALTLAQDVPSAEFHATPHYCLRQLGLIDQHGRRGGRQYSQFAESLSRLAAVHYDNNGFYDTIRKEHRRVGFGFLSYSLPQSNNSSRAWRISWDALFFEFASSVGGRMRFDLQTYRELDPASRRLFLFATKIFRRRATMRLDLREIAVQVLGYSPSLAERDLRVKVKRVLHRLKEQNILSDWVMNLDANRSPSRTTLELTRGNYFRTKAATSDRRLPVESPLAELLRSIGLDDAAIIRCQKKFPMSLLQEWADITLAALERHGPSFFKRSPAAYFMDNVQHAAQGTRTPPDWWHDLQRAERRTQANVARQQSAAKTTTDVENPLESIADAVFQHFQANGQSAEVAQVNAQRFAAACQVSSNRVDPKSLLRLLK